VSQALFNMKAYHALKFGREYTAVRRTQYEETRRSLLTAAKKTYFQAVLLNEIVKVKEASETTDRDNHRDVKRKFEAGAVPELDVLQAEVAWKTKIAETAQARKNLQVALVAMKALAGMPPDAAAFPSEALAEVPPLPDAADPDRAAAARPDYELLLRGRRMAEIAVDLARADRYPAVSASLSYGYSAANDRFSAGGGTDVLQLGIKIDLPVYTGGAVSTNVEIEKISLEKSDIGLAKMRDAVAAEISQIRLSLEEAKQRIDSAKALVAVAEKAHALAKLSRENGLLTQLELGEASVQLENARIGRSAAVFDYLAAYFDWEKATGKP
jgi:outer membrane protein TolC